MSASLTPLIDECRRATLKDKADASYDPMALFAEMAHLKVTLSPTRYTAGVFYIEPATDNGHFEVLPLSQFFTTPEVLAFASGLALPDYIRSARLRHPSIEGVHFSFIIKLQDKLPPKERLKTLQDINFLYDAMLEKFKGYELIVQLINAYSGKQNKGVVWNRKDLTISGGKRKKPIYDTGSGVSIHWNLLKYIY